MAWATDFNNDAEVKETHKFLNQTIVDKNHFVTKFKAHDGSLLNWGGLALDKVALPKVKPCSQIKNVDAEPKAEKNERL
jgi:hypothetical protein